MSNTMEPIVHAVAADSQRRLRRGNAASGAQGRAARTANSVSGLGGGDNPMFKLPPYTVAGVVASCAARSLLAPRGLGAGLGGLGPDSDAEMLWRSIEQG